MLTQYTKLAGSLLLAFSSLSAADAVAQKMTPPAAPGSEKSVALVGKKPQFKGGDIKMLAFIQANIKHPNPERAATIPVTFEVATDGSLHNIRVLRSITEEFDKEAIRVVKMMDKMWEPGMQDGKAVKVQQTIAVHFRHDFKQPVAKPNTTTEGEKPYTFVEKMPKFQGGEMEMFKHIAREIKYPRQAINAGVEGQVFVSFVVSTSGEIGDIRVIRGLGAGTDEEAIRVIQSTNGKWEPGMQNGKAVPVRYNLPIKFSLRKEPVRAAVAPVPDAPATTPPVAANRAPAYKGGAEALHQALAGQLELPKDVNRENLYASLSLKFMVEKDGSLSNIRLEGPKVMKTISPGSEFDYMDGNKIGLLNKSVVAKLAEAATAALKSTSGNWEPGLLNGHKDRVEMELPVSYRGAAKPVVGETSAPGLKHVAPKLLKDDPAFKGDSNGLLRFISKNIHFPEGAPDRGQVTVALVLDTDKTIKEIRYYMASSSVLDAEVRRVMELVKGSPFQESSNTRLGPITFTINFQTQTSQTPLQPADIYVVKYK